jgi:hypothetical protein
MDAQPTFSRRKQRRFKTCDEQPLRCVTFVEFEDPVEGTVVDISANGLRLLCGGKFTVGQAFLTELKTDRLHGVFPGVVRRVQPWTEGKSVLGCQLLESIPDHVLAALATEGVLNRRDHERVQWKYPAKATCELQSSEIDIEIQDCSLGGLKIYTQAEIPDEARLRIRVGMDGEEQVEVNAKTRWQQNHHDGYLAGLAFTSQKIPEVIRRAVAGKADCDDVEAIVHRKRPLFLGILTAAAIILIGLAVYL